MHFQSSHPPARRNSISVLRSISEEKSTDKPLNSLSFNKDRENKAVPQTTSDINATPGVSATYSKRRRPSFQCDTIITKDFNGTIPYSPLHREGQDFPSPMHAVMRHYEVVLKSANSEYNLRKSTSQIDLKSTSIKQSLEGSVENVSKTGELQQYLKKRRSSLPVTLKSVKVTDLDDFWKNYRKGVDRNGNKYVRDDNSSLAFDSTTESTLSSVEEEVEQETPNEHENQSTERLKSQITEALHETAL